MKPVRKKLLDLDFRLKPELVKEILTLANEESIAIKYSFSALPRAPCAFHFFPLTFPVRLPSELFASAKSAGEIKLSVRVRVRLPALLNNYTLEPAGKFATNHSRVAILKQKKAKPKTSPFFTANESPRRKWTGYQSGKDLILLGGTLSFPPNPSSACLPHRERMGGIQKTIIN